MSTPNTGGPTSPTRRTAVRTHSRNPSTFSGGASSFNASQLAPSMSASAFPYQSKQPPPGMMRGDVTKLTLAERMERFYRERKPDMLPKVPELSERFKNRDAEVIAAMVNKYGPEPDYFVPDPAALSASRTQVVTRQQPVQQQQQPPQQPQQQQPGLNTATPVRRKVAVKSSHNQSASQSFVGAVPSDTQSQTSSSGAHRQQVVRVPVVSPALTPAKPTATASASATATATHVDPSIPPTAPVTSSQQQPTPDKHNTTAPPQPTPKGKQSTKERLAMLTKWDSDEDSDDNSPKRKVVAVVNKPKMSSSMVSNKDPKEGTGATAAVAQQQQNSLNMSAHVDSPKKLQQTQPPPPQPPAAQAQEDDTAKAPEATSRVPPATMADDSTVTKDSMSPPPPKQSTDVPLRPPAASSATAQATDQRRDSAPSSPLVPSNRDEDSSFDTGQGSKSTASALPAATEKSDTKKKEPHLQLSQFQPTSLEQSRNTTMEDSQRPQQTSIVKDSKPAPKGHVTGAHGSSSQDAQQLVASASSGGGPFRRADPQMKEKTTKFVPTEEQKEQHKERQQSNSRGGSAAASAAHHDGADSDRATVRTTAAKKQPAQPSPRTRTPRSSSAPRSSIPNQQQQKRASSSQRLDSSSRKGDNHDDDDQQEEPSAIGEKAEPGVVILGGGPTPRNRPLPLAPSSTMSQSSTHHQQPHHNRANESPHRSNSRTSLPTSPRQRGLEYAKANREAAMEKSQHRRTRSVESVEARRERRQKEDEERQKKLSTDPRTYHLGPSGARRGHTPPRRSHSAGDRKAHQLGYSPPRTLVVETWVSPLRQHRTQPRKPPLVKEVEIDRTKFVPNLKNPPLPEDVLGVRRDHIRCAVNLGAKCDRNSYLQRPDRCSIVEGNMDDGTMSCVTHTTNGGDLKDNGAVLNFDSINELLRPFEQYSSFDVLKDPTKRQLSAWALAPPPPTVTDTTQTATGAGTVKYVIKTERPAGAEARKRQEETARRLARPKKYTMRSHAHEASKVNNLR